MKKQVDITKIFDKAQAMTTKANSEQDYQAAARQWLKLKFDGVDFYFQDKVDYCLEMAKKFKDIDRVFRR